MEEAKNDINVIMSIWNGIVCMAQKLWNGIKYVFNKIKEGIQYIGDCIQSFFHGYLVDIIFIYDVAKKCVSIIIIIL